MNEKPLRALLIKRNKNKLIENHIYKLDIEDTIFIDNLDNLYKLLECERIDIQVRYINGKPYDFIFDDEYIINGKSQEPKNAVAIGERNGEILECIFGNLLICGIANNKGEETSLTEEDIKNILQSQKIYSRQTDDKHYFLIKYDFE